MKTNVNGFTETQDTLSFRTIYDIYEWMKRNIEDVSASLVIFDLEGIFIDADKPELSTLYTYSNIALLNSLAGYELTQEQLSIFRTLLLTQHKQTTTGEELDLFCRILQERGAKKIGLSSMLTGNIESRGGLRHQVAYLETLTEELKLDFYDFGIKDTSIVRGIAPYLGGYPVFHKGILFTNGEFDQHAIPTLGRVLSNFLLLTKWINNFKTVIYIGKSKDSVINVLAALNNRNISCDLYGIHYDRPCSTAALNMNVLMDNWKQILRILPRDIEYSIEFPVQILQTNFFSAANSVARSRFSFLTTGLYGGVAQFSLAPSAKLKPICNPDVEQIWAFKGEMDVTVFRKNIYPGEVSFTNPAEYAVLTIPAGTHFKIKNNSNKPAHFLIAYVPTWTGTPLTRRVQDFEVPLTAEPPAAKVSPSATMLESVHNSLAVKQLAAIKDATLIQYTLRKCARSTILLSDEDQEGREDIMINQGLSGINLEIVSQNRLGEYSNTLVGSAVDQYVSAKIPGNTLYYLKNLHEQPVSFLMLKVNRPYGSLQFSGYS